MTDHRFSPVELSLLLLVCMHAYRHLPADIRKEWDSMRERLGIETFSELRRHWPYAAILGAMLAIAAAPLCYYTWEAAIRLTPLLA